MNVALAGRTTNASANGLVCFRAAVTGQLIRKNVLLTTVEAKQIGRTSTASAALATGDGLSCACKLLVPAPKRAAAHNKVVNRAFMGGIIVLPLSVASAGVEHASCGLTMPARQKTASDGYRSDALSVMHTTAWIHDDAFAWL